MKFEVRQGKALQTASGHLNLKTGPRKRGSGLEQSCACNPNTNRSEIIMNTTLLQDRNLAGLLSPKYCAEIGPLKHSSITGPNEDSFNVRRSPG